jgi:hypothetical protein
VQTGEPLFRKLASALSADFRYRLESEQPGELRGTYRLVAELGALNGWKRTIELQPQQIFSGHSFIAYGVLDLAQVQALIEHLEQQTAMQRQQYILAIVPEVHVEGTLAGQALRDEFAPRLEFRVDELQIQLIKGDGSVQDSLKPSKPGLLKRTQTESNTLALLGLTLDVTTARWAALIGLALALAGVGVIGVPMLQTMRRDAAVRIRMKYGALIVDVVGADRRADEGAIELVSIDDLAKLAEKHGAMILHAADDTADRYMVHDGTISYYYQFTERQHATSVAAPEVPHRQPGDSQAQRGQAPPRLADLPAVWQTAFLAVLREQGMVSAACRAVGVDIMAAYGERQRVPAFARAWDEVRATAHHLTESEEL